MATEERIQRSFATGPSCELTVSNVHGAITVAGWDQPETEVLAVKHGAVQVEVTGEGSHVEVRTRGALAEGLLSWLGISRRGAKVDYHIQVPRTSRVTVSGVTGSITVSDVEGMVAARMVEGRVSLRRVKGQASLETVNGRLEVRDVAGDLRAKAVNGEVQVEGGHLTGLAANTVNGLVQAETTVVPEGRYVVNTVSGDFHLLLPEDATAQVEARGVNVGVNCDLPHRVESQGWGHWSGHVGPNGDAPSRQPLVRFQTVNGRLHISARTAPATEPEPTDEAPEEIGSPEPAGQEEPVRRTPMEVLKAVEAGELSVDQALEELGR
jgi:hypothetical protein